MKIFTFFRELALPTLHHSLHPAVMNFGAACFLSESETATFQESDICKKKMNTTVNGNATASLSFVMLGYKCIKLKSNVFTQIYYFS